MVEKKVNVINFIYKRNNNWIVLEVYFVICMVSKSFIKFKIVI